MRVENFPFVRKYEKSRCFRSFMKAAELLIIFFKELVYTGLDYYPLKLPAEEYQIFCF